MRLTWVALVGVLLIAPAWTATAGSGDTVEKSYVLGTGPVKDAECGPRANGTGGACFVMHPDAERVELTVDDEVSQQVAAQWRLEGSDGQDFGSEIFCDETMIFNPNPEDFPVKRLRVTVLAPGLAASVCDSTPTTGTISASFTTG